MKARKSVRNSVLLTLGCNFFGLLYSSVLAFFLVGGLWLLGTVGLWLSTDSLAESAGCIRQLAHDDVEDIATWRQCANDLETIAFWQEFSERIYTETTTDTVSGERMTEHLRWSTVKRGFETLFWLLIVWPVAILTGIFTTKRHNRKVTLANERVAGTQGSAP